MVIDDGDAEMQLDIGPLQLRTGLEEGRAFRKGRGDEALAMPLPGQQLAQEAQAADRAQAEVVGVAGGPSLREIEVILQVLAYARQGAVQGDAVRQDVLGPAHADNCSNCGDQRPRRR
jgi:hypothetical protein